MKKIFTSWYGNISNIYDLNRLLRWTACGRVGIMAVVMSRVAMHHEEIWKLQTWTVPWLMALWLVMVWWLVIPDMRRVIKLSKPLRKRIWRPMYIVNKEYDPPVERLKGFMDREALYKFWGTPTMYRDKDGNLHNLMK